MKGNPHVHLVLLLFVAIIYGKEITKIHLPVGDCPARDVIVYDDMADVTRLVNFETSQEGEHEVVVSGVSMHITDDSIRVLSGVGDATILEVSTRATAIRTTNPTTDPEVLKLKKELAEVEENLTLVGQEIKQAKAELQWLHDYAKVMTGAGIQQKDPFSDENVQHSLDFIKVYGRHMAEMEKRVDDYRVKRDELTLKQQKIRALISEKEWQTPPKVDDIVLRIHVSTPGQVSLQVAYLVPMVSWEPSYEIRVSSETAEAQLFYYGTVTNWDDENWLDVNLALSTAKPSTNGAPPQLETLNVKWQSTTQHQKRPIQGMATGSAAPYQSFSQGRSHEESEVGGYAYRDVDVMSTQVVAGFSSANFKIPRKADLPADKLPHKVLIGKIYLKGKFSYVIIPKKSEQAFLTANFTNDSEYPLLPGMIRVYLDNNFVAKSEIQHIPEGEIIQVNLGVDNSIRVKRKGDRIHSDTVGFITKSSVQHYSHVTVIKNTKKIKVPITVYEQIPLSSDAQLKVEIHKPVLLNDNKEPKSDVFMNDKNILVWRTTLAPDHKETFAVDYTIEFPAANKIELVDNVKYKYK